MLNAIETLMKNFSFLFFFVTGIKHLSIHITGIYFDILNNLELKSLALYSSYLSNMNVSVSFISQVMFFLLIVVHVHVVEQFH